MKKLIIFAGLLVLISGCSRPGMLAFAPSTPDLGATLIPTVDTTLMPHAPTATLLPLQITPPLPSPLPLPSPWPSPLPFPAVAVAIAVTLAVDVAVALPSPSILPEPPSFSTPGGAIVEVQQSETLSRAEIDALLADFLPDGNQIPSLYAVDTYRIRLTTYDEFGQLIETRADVRFPQVDTSPNSRSLCMALVPPALGMAAPPWMNRPGIATGATIAVICSPMRPRALSPSLPIGNGLTIRTASTPILSPSWRAA